MLATETSFLPPLPAGIADLSAPELMAIVMRRTGEGTTRDDFHQALETCQFTDTQLDLNIGAAQRILAHETERAIYPPRPLMPWDADPSYRQELVERGGRMVALGMADTADIVTRLMAGGFDPEAIIALWDSIIAEAIRLLQRNPPLAPLARAIADLDAAVAAYDTGDLNAEARNLAHSMRSALDGLRHNQELPRTHVLATIRAFAHANEWSGFDGAHQAKVLSALAMLTTVWGL